jgi:hypothetical protein
MKVILFPTLQKPGGPQGFLGREVFGHVPDSEVCNLTIREVTKAHRGERWLGWPVSFWRSQWH